MAHETNTKPPRLVTESQAAKIWGSPGSTWQRWRHEGHSPPYIQITATSIRYRVDHVEAWLEDCTVRPSGATVS